MFETTFLFQSFWGQWSRWGHAICHYIYIHALESIWRAIGVPHNGQGKTWIICCGRSVGFFKNSLTIAVSFAGSSRKLSRKLSRSSSAFLILLAYSPMFQIIDAFQDANKCFKLIWVPLIWDLCRMGKLQAVSSNVSRLSQSVVKTDSYMYIVLNDTATLRELNTLRCHNKGNSSKSAYVFGCLLKISLMTIMASWTTWFTLILIRSS